MGEQQIIYREIPPYKDLAPFIDAFWTVVGANIRDQADKILPDGCVDIIYNYGPPFTTEQGTTLLHSGEAYLVGTMTRYKEMVRPPGTRLLGIRFKPGGFTCFYDPTLLRCTADRTVQFDRTLFPSVGGDADPAPVLNRFFLDRLEPASVPLSVLIAEIRRLKGCISVDRLAKQHFITVRTLERLFEKHLAIGPRAFINFVRFQHARESVSRRHGKRLLDIACEHGYYDAAHLANAFQKYMGASPTGG